MAPQDLDIAGAVNYASFIPDYAKQELDRRRIQIAAGTLSMQNAQEARLLAKQQADAAALAEQQRQVEEAIANPTATNIGHLMLRNPGMATQAKQAWDLQDEDSRRSAFQRVSELSVLAGQDPRRAGAKLREQAINDPSPDDDLEVARLLESDDPNEVKQGLAQLHMLAYIATGDHEKYLEAHKTYEVPDFAEIGQTGYIQNKNTGEVFRSGVLQYGAGGADIDPRFMGMPLFQPGGGGAAGTPPMPGATTGGFAGGRFDTATGRQVDPQAVFSRMIGLESGGNQFDPRGKTMRSKKGAIGIAQVMPKTGPEAARLAGEKFDLKRLATDADYNRRLGQAYYNKQLQTFGDPFKAAAAYNGGPGKLRAALKKGGEEGWLNHMEPETQKYVADLAGGAQQADPARVRADAQAAIAAGADPAKVAAKAEKMGVRL